MELGELVRHVLDPTYFCTTVTRIFVLQNLPWSQNEAGIFPHQVALNVVQKMRANIFAICHSVDNKFCVAKPSMEPKRGWDISSPGGTKSSPKYEGSFCYFHWTQMLMINFFKKIPRGIQFVSLVDPLATRYVVQNMGVNFI